MLTGYNIQMSVNTGLMRPSSTDLLGLSLPEMVEMPSALSLLLLVFSELVSVSSVTESPPSEPEPLGPRLESSTGRKTRPWNTPYTTVRPNICGTVLKVFERLKADSNLKECEEYMR